MNDTNKSWTKIEKERDEENRLMGKLDGLFEIREELSDLYIKIRDEKRDGIRLALEKVDEIYRETRFQIYGENPHIRPIMEIIG